MTKATVPTRMNAASPLRTTPGAYPLYGQRCSSRSGESAGELGEDGQVSVKLDPLKATNAKGQKRPLVFEPPELTLDGGTALVELGPGGCECYDKAVLFELPVTGWKTREVPERKGILYAL